MVLLTNNRHLNLYALYSNGVTSPSLQSVKICLKFYLSVLRYSLSLKKTWLFYENWLIDFHLKRH